MPIKSALKSILRHFFILSYFPFAMPERGLYEQITCI